VFELVCTSCIPLPRWCGVERASVAPARFRATIAAIFSYQFRSSSVQSSPLNHARDTGVDQKFDLWRQKVFDLVDLKHAIGSVISMLPHRKGTLDSMVRWYSRKAPFTIWDRSSKRIGMLMKMLVIKLKSDC
jgi:hypothetical protein